MCGLPGASSLMVSVPPREPVAAGENVTLIVHCAPAAKVAGGTGQVFVCAKSPLLVPVIPMLVIVKGPVPLFVSVTDLDVLAVPTR